ncbi:MAG: apolipoprotein N-acyltransferase [Fulvivirga sp.]
MNLTPQIFKSKLSLAILSGLLLVLAWPPISLTPLLFVAFVPLLYVLNELKSSKKVFLYSYLAFFIWTLGTMYWIGNARVGGRGYLVMSMAWLLIPLFQCFPIMVFYWVRKYWKSANWMVLPLIWVAYEYLHSQWDLAFTWLHLGFGLTPSPFFIQFYKITGYLGGSLILMYINVFVVLMLINYKKASVKKYVISTAMLIALLLIGNFLIKPSKIASSRNAKIAIVQLSQDPYTVLEKKTVWKAVTQAEEALKDLPEDVDLVVFPEGFVKSSPAAPIVFNNPDSDSVILALKRISRKIKAPILTGFIGFKLFRPDQAPSNALPTGDGAYFSGYNGAMLISHDQPTQIQTKRHLVPFMERVPFLEYFSYFENFRLGLNQMMGSYGKSSSSKILKYKQLRIAPFICLDGLFPADGGTFVDQRANLVAVITNDGWAGNTSGYRQNSSYATSLAVSLNRSVVRAAATGISRFIDISGKSHGEVQ